MLYHRKPHPAWTDSMLHRRQTGTQNKPKAEEKPKTVREIIREYLNESTLHGVRYTVKDDFILFRILWILAVLTCVGCAMYFMAKAWVNFFESPILTTVRNAYYPLYEIYFPAITICPGFNIKRRIGLDLLYRDFKSKFPGEDDANINLTLIRFMRALTYQRYPYYRLMSYELDKIQNIAVFDSLNITEFMLQTLPTMSDLFHTCRWQGEQTDCKELFALQRYEGGFCYAFNSLTSVDCRRNVHDCEKHMKRNAAAGTTTGLEVFLNKRTTEDHLGEGDQDAKGVRVMIHDPSELPQAGNGLFIMDNKPKVGIIKIVASVTTSSQRMRTMAARDRNCYFEDEQSLIITHEYSQDDCLIECRLKYLMYKCRCQPYFFSFPEDDSEECKPSQFQCIVDESKNLKFLQDPSNTLDKMDGKTSCTTCLPSCSSINYDVDAVFTEESKPINDSSVGYLNVYYKEQSAVEYYRVLAIDRMQLLVSVGGIAGLFLGFSLLSLFEIFYYFCKCVSSCFKSWFCPKSSTKPEPQSTAPPSTVQQQHEYTNQYNKYPPYRHFLFE